MSKQNILTILIVLLIVLGGVWYMQSQPSDPQQRTESISILNKNISIPESVDSNSNSAIEIKDYVGNDESKKTNIKVPRFSSNGDVEMVTYQVPYTQSVLNATLKKLFELESSDNGYNGLAFDSASLDSGIASLKFTGSWYPVGDLSGTYMRRLINRSVFQFDTVDAVEVFINDKRFDWCIDSEADVSESNCDTTPRYWIDSRQDYLDLEEIFSHN